MEIEYLLDKVEVFGVLAEHFGGEATPRLFFEEVFEVPTGEVEVIEQTWRNRYRAEQARLFGRPVRVVRKGDGGVIEKTWVHSTEGVFVKLGTENKPTGYVALERIESVEVL